MVEGVGRYIKKGQLIQVVGRIETSEHNGKYYWNLNVSNVTLLSKSEQTSENKAPPPNMDDIPF